MRLFLWLAAFIWSGVLGFSLSWSVYHNKEDAASIGPGDIPITPIHHSPVSFVKQLKGDHDAGRKIFKEFCAACHDANPRIDINAPHVGDRKTWQGLSQLGMKTLLNMTIKGVKAMPARGGCFECSDDQLREAIEYMLKNSNSTTSIRD